jgi:hypothetical protein
MRVSSFVVSWRRSYFSHYRRCCLDCLRLLACRDWTWVQYAFGSLWLFGDRVWMTGYIPYLSEIHAQILELHTTYVPTDYRSQLRFLLQPAIWQQKGSVPRSRYHSMATDFVIHIRCLGGRVIMQEIFRCEYSFFVTECDRVLTDMIQCGTETIFPGNHLCACRRTWLTHMFAFFAYFWLFTMGFKVNGSFWSTSSVPLRKYNPGSRYLRIYLRSPVLMSSCRRSWQILNNFIVAHYPSCRSKITGFWV